MNDLLERQLVEEAVLLAETAAAVEASRNTSAAEEVTIIHKIMAILVWVYYTLTVWPVYE